MRDQEVVEEETHKKRKNHHHITWCNTSFSSTETHHEKIYWLNPFSFFSRYPQKSGKHRKRETRKREEKHEIHLTTTTVTLDSLKNFFFPFAPSGKSQMVYDDHEDQKRRVKKNIRREEYSLTCYLMSRAKSTVRQKWGGKNESDRNEEGGVTCSYNSLQKSQKWRRVEQTIRDEFLFRSEMIMTMIIVIVLNWISSPFRKTCLMLRILITSMESQGENGWSNGIRKSSTNGFWDKKNAQSWVEKRTKKSHQEEMKRENWIDLLLFPSVQFSMLFSPSPLKNAILTTWLFKSSPHLPPTPHTRFIFSYDAWKTGNYWK